MHGVLKILPTLVGSGHSVVLGADVPSLAAHLLTLDATPVPHVTEQDDCAAHCVQLSVRLETQKNFAKLNIL